MLTPPMFGETRLATPYFQQMTLHSKISKIIDTSLQNNRHLAPKQFTLHSIFGSE